MGVSDIALAYKRLIYFGRKNIIYRKVLTYAGELGLEPIDKQICVFSALEPKTNTYAYIYAWDFTEISKKAEQLIKRRLRSMIKRKIKEKNNDVLLHN